MNMRVTAILEKTLQFFFHQLLSTLGVIILSGMVGFAVARFAERWLSHFSPHRALTETHVFPIQIIIAGLISLIVSYTSTSRLMIRVWILPGVILLITLIHLSATSSLGNSISVLFGDGCTVRQRCFYQLWFTLPFYSAATYSAVAFLLRSRASRRGS